MALQDIFDSPAGGAAPPPKIPAALPKPGKDIFDDEPAQAAAPAAAPSGPLTVNNIPAGHLAMTDPSGNLQAVHHTQAGQRMKEGWRVGPPAQQDPSAMRQAWKSGFTDPLEAVGGFARESGSAVKGLATTVGTPPQTPGEWASLLAGPGGPAALRMGKGYVGGVKENLEKGKQAGERNQPFKVGGRAFAATVPVLGGLVGRAMDVGEDVESGKMSGPESSGRAASLITQAALTSPKVSGPVGKVAGAVTQDLLTAAKIKALPVSALNPAEQLAKTASPTKMMAVHGAAKVALPDIQEAAAGMGQPIQTVEHGIAAAKQAKINVATEAQAKLDAQGAGKTLADAPEEYHAKVKAIDTVQEHLEGLAQKKTAIADAAAKANKNVPVTRGEAAVSLAKGTGKAGLGLMVPGGPIVHGAMSAAGLLGGAGDIVRGIRGLAKPSGAALTADAIDAPVSRAFQPPPTQPRQLPSAPGPDPYAAPIGPVDARVPTRAPVAVPSGVPTNTAAVPGSGVAPVAGPPPAGGPLTSTAQVSRTPSGFPQTDVAPPPPAVTASQLPEGVSLAPSEGSVAMAHPDQPQTVLHMRPELVEHAKKAGFEVVDAKKTEPGLTEAGNKTKSLVNKHRQELGLDEPVPPKKAAAKPKVEVPDDTEEKLRASLDKNKPPAEAADAEEPWRKALYEKPATTESAATPAAQNAFEKKVVNHFSDQPVGPKTLAKLWEKVSPHVTKDLTQNLKLEGAGMENPVIDIAEDKVAKIGMGPAQPIPNIPEVLQPIESGSVAAPELGGKDGMHYHVMPKATDTQGVITQAEIAEVKRSMAAKGWAMPEKEAHGGNFGRYKDKWVVIDSSGMYRIPIKK